MTAYLLRICLALDAFVQAFFHFGTLGITISSRAGTAAAHGHRWGLVVWWLLDRFRKNHCKYAIENDRKRAQAVIEELNDPVVVAYLAAL